METKKVNTKKTAHDTTHVAKEKTHTTNTQAHDEKTVKVFSISDAREQLFKDHKDRYTNIHMVPQITHITLSMCCGKFMNDGGKMTQIEQQLRNIACQQPIHTKARKSNASFKLRQGMHIGFVVTLRGKQATNFLFKLIYINMPRIQDFQPLSSKSFDNNGNYNIGLKDINAFIETNHDLITNVGMNISIATTSTQKEDTMLLFKALKMPFADFLDKE